MPYLRHLSTSADLITAPEEIRAGFVALALERSRRATPFVEQARALKVAAMRVNHPNELLGIEGIRVALLTAAGFSEKATKQIEEKDHIVAIFANENLSPALFFIGAVIADSMSQEIWYQLENGTLKNAANLTNPDQVASLANWLVDL